MRLKIYHTLFPQRRAAFTLVEMIVSIAIIILLLVFSFGAIQRSISSGKNAQCASNLRQIWLRMQTYIYENNGNFPSSWMQDTYSFWPSQVNYAVGAGNEGTYYSDLSIYICPAVKKENLAPGLRENSPVGDPYVSYGLNYKGVTQNTVKKSRSTANLLAIEEPSKLIAILDAEDPIQPYDGWYLANAPDMKSYWSNSAISKRHGGMLNAVFCDGHVQRVDENFLFSEATNSPPWSDSPWYRDKYIRPDETQ